MSIDDLLRAASELKASDLHLKVGTPPHIRVDGEMQPLPNHPRTSADQMNEFTAAVTNERQRMRLEESGQVDLAYGVAGVGRFRANVFQQRGSTAMAMRVVPNLIQSFEELRLPHVVERL